MKPDHEQPLLQVSALRKSFMTGGWKRNRTSVLQDVHFSVGQNEILGLVGASGAGKSTLGRIIAGLEDADSGEIAYQGHNVIGLRGHIRKQVSRSIQMIFQDPYEALSPRLTIEQLIEEPLVIHDLYKKDRTKRRQLVREALEEVSLTPPERYMSRYPHELSGGERQRVGLARAFILQPSLIIADEPTSMLDTSLRHGLLQLMKERQRRYPVSYLFITHDLALTQGFCDRLLVLDQGEIVEAGTTEDIIERPQHRFTQSLIQALVEMNQL